MQRPKSPQWLRGARHTCARVGNVETGRNEAMGQWRWGNGDGAKGDGAKGDGATATGQGALVKMVDAAAARAAVVRPLLAHAHVAVRWQVGALELARGAPPDAAAHAVRAKLLVLQVIEPL